MLFNHYELLNILVNLFETAFRSVDLIYDRCK